MLQISTAFKCRKNFKNRATTRSYDVFSIFRGNGKFDGKFWRKMENVCNFIANKLPQNVFFQFFNRMSLTEVSVFQKSENYRKNAGNVEEIKNQFLYFVRQTLSFTTISTLIKSVYSIKRNIKIHLGDGAAESGLINS